MRLEGLLRGKDGLRADQGATLYLITNRHRGQASSLSSEVS